VLPSIFYRRGASLIHGCTKSSEIEGRVF